MDELEQPAAQDSAPQAEAPQTDEDLDVGLLDEQQTDEEEDELEGVKLKGKRDLIEKIKSERLMQADYTRKTQAVAEERKAIESARQAAAQQMQMANQYRAEIKELAGAEKQIEWMDARIRQALNDGDRDTAFSLDFQKRQLQDAKSQLEQSLSQKQQQALYAQQQDVARQVQEGQAVLQREIKGWSPELASKLVQFGVERGFQQQDLQSVTNPAIVKLLHDAFTLDQLRKSASKKPVQAQEKPVTTISAQKAPANRDPDKMSTNDWLKWREANLKRK